MPVCEICGAAGAELASPIVAAAFPYLCGRCAEIADNPHAIMCADWLTNDQSYDAYRANDTLTVRRQRAHGITVHTGCSYAGAMSDAWVVEGDK